MSNQNQQNYASSELFRDGQELIESISGFKVEIKAGFDQISNLKLTKEVEPKNLKGLTYPKNFKIERLIDSKDLVSLMDEWATFCDGIGGKEGEIFWSPLLNPRGGTTNTPLAAHTSMLLAVDDKSDSRYTDKRPDKKISVHPNKLKPGQVPESYLPEKDWFKPELNEIQIKDILTIFPEAEAEVLAIAIGRAVVGPAGVKHLESDEEIMHTYRTFPVMYGEDPGQGKSDLFIHYVIPALKYAGYRYGEVKTFYEKHGLGDIAEADLAYKDDMTHKELMANLQGTYTKTLISGGGILVENKYIKSYVAYAGCALFANINEFDIGELVEKVDEGVINRLAILKTKSNIELKQWVGTGASKGSKSPFIMNHLHYLCDKYDIEPLVLGLWFLRLCADKFMTLIDDRKSIAEGNNKLAKKVISLYKELRVQVNHALMTKNTCILLQFAHLLRNPGISIPELEVEELTEVLGDGTYLALMKDLAPVRRIIYQDWKDQDKPDAHPYVALNTLRKTSMIEAVEASNKTLLNNRTDITKGIKSVFGPLLTKSGFSVHYSRVKVSASWNAATHYMSSDLAKNLQTHILQTVSSDVINRLQDNKEMTINEIRSHSLNN